ncbi:MAG: hypothetical protein U5P10_17845 [Spirochaetia bacterium]|nr:hypothetical protein [Spirochaetia bacterium]
MPVLPAFVSIGYKDPSKGYTKSTSALEPLSPHPEARFFELAGFARKELLPDDLLGEASPVEGVQIVYTYVSALQPGGIVQ